MVRPAGVRVHIEKCVLGWRWHPQVRHLTGPSRHSAPRQRVQAVSYFEKFFEVARSLGDARMLDAARVNLGVARAAAWREAYLGVVGGDVDALLHWKNLRVPFTEAA